MEWNTWLFSWRLVGLIFLILAGSALAYIHFHASGHMPASASAGGAIGQSLGRVAVDALNVQGSTLVFFALFLFGLTVFADLSWFKVMDVTGKITLDFFELIQNAFNRWMGARRAQATGRATARGRRARRRGGGAERARTAANSPRPRSACWNAKRPWPST